MNEKIIELAEQSGYQEGSRFAMEDFDMYIFARLILQEAMGIVRDEVAYQSDLDFADVVIKKVKEHFGVE